MNPDQVLEVIAQYHELSKPSGWGLLLLWTPVITSVIALFSMITVFWNVNRTQKKNKQNDIEKFKRDLELKSADEMIEAITSVKEACHGIITLDMILKMLLDNKIDVGAFVAHIDKCNMDIHMTTLKVVSQYKKREIVLKKYSQYIEGIYDLGTVMGEDLIKIRKWYTSDPGLTDQQINTEIQKTIEKAKNIADDLNRLLREIQNEFLGSIFNEKL